MEHFSLEGLKAAAQAKERTLFRYESLPSRTGKRFYETRVIRTSNPGERPLTLLFGFRDIDQIVEQEQARAPRVL
ncbi:hypothetical protein [Paratractidigestivibacter sp.]|uniref:hypothetical protein n=1 Tax=Paratractidigestivibacter sp. TaxID=2847316 RepID=UPI002ABD1CF3|nr:hypothetical protein [Paratractidigestivibacter sp.]